MVTGTLANEQRGAWQLGFKTQPRFGNTKSLAKRSGSCHPHRHMLEPGGLADTLGTAGTWGSATSNVITVPRTRLPGLVWAKGSHKGMRH